MGEHGQRLGSSCQCEKGWIGFHCDKPTIACDHGKVRCAGKNSHCGHADPKKCVCDTNWKGKGCDVNIHSGQATGATGRTGSSTGATGATGSRAAKKMASAATVTNNEDIVGIDKPDTEQRFVETKIEGST